jgi:hypothetical protein
MPSLRILYDVDGWASLHQARRSSGTPPPTSPCGSRPHWTRARYAELARHMQRDIRAWEWRLRIPALFGVFREVLAGPGRLALVPA